MILETIMEIILGGFVVISDRCLLAPAKGNSLSERAFRGFIYAVWLISALLFSWLTVQLSLALIQGEGNWAIILVGIICLGIAIWVDYRLWRYTKALFMS